MAKIKIPPDKAAYAVEESARDAVVALPVAGGLPRTRRDIIGPARRVSVSWTTTPDGYEYLRAFYKLTGAKGLPFEMDLVLDSATPVEHRVFWVPGSLKLSVKAGLVYQIQAQVEVNVLTPDPATGVFVAVGGGAVQGIAARSVDGGETWAEYAMPVFADDGISFGNGAFVAVNANSDVAATSPTGEVWTPRALPTSAHWRSIAFGNGVHVTVGRDSIYSTRGRVAVSDDGGATWSHANLPTSTGGDWYVAFTNGVFLAVNHGANLAAVSTTGLTWTAITLPVTGTWFAVVGGAGRFLAFALSTALEPTFLSVATTVDNGVQWTLTVVPNGMWFDPAYSDDRRVFAVMAGTQAQAATTTDGVTFTAHPTPQGGNWAVAAGLGRFVAAGYGDGTPSLALVSVDGGATWAQHTIAAQNRVYQAIAFGVPWSGIE